MSQTKAELIEPQGNVAFDTNTLYVDATNNRVGVGTTSPGKNVDIEASDPRLRLSSNASNNATVELLSNAKTSFIYSQNSGNLNLQANNELILLASAGTERARIDSSGRLLVGTSSARTNYLGGGTAPSLQVEGTGFPGSALSLTRNETAGAGAGLLLGRSRGTTNGSNTVVIQDDGLGIVSFQGADGTNLVEGARISAAVDGTPGANDMPGRLIFATTADGASSPTERMRIKQNGVVLIGKTADDGSAGFKTDVNSTYMVADAQTPVYVNRNNNDGTLIEFRQDTVAEGTISVSGTTVSYNGAHLSRWSQLPGGAERTEILRGTVLSNIDEMCDWTDEENEQLNRMKVSDVEGDKNVAGVFQAWDDDDDTYTNDFYCAMTGDFIIRIGAGVTVERGDLLISAGDGTAKPQDDDIIRSKTIAKVTSTNVSCTYDDGSYCVPCVLMAC